MKMATTALLSYEGNPSTGPITVTCSVSHPPRGGRVSVVFTKNGTNAGTDKASPYQITMTLDVGTHILGASVYSRNGSLAATATPLTIVVSSPIPTPTPIPSTSLKASNILGQRNFKESVPYSPARGDRLYNPIGVVIDTRISPSIMYVNDGGNNRIISYEWPSVWDINTGSRSSQPIPLNIFGQNDDPSGCAANGDSNFTQFPNWPIPSASTLAGMQLDTITPAESGAGSGMTIDLFRGGFWTVDFYNNRALHYSNANPVADRVLGQDNFSGHLPNRGNVTCDNHSLYLSWNIDSNNNTYSAGIAVDPISGRVWIADSGNHRTVGFSASEVDGHPSGGAQADIQFGQIDFIHRSVGSALNQEWSPTDVCLSVDRKTLYSTDATNQRVVKYVSSTAGFEPTDSGSYGILFGTGWFKPMCVKQDTANHPGRLWIYDASLHSLFLINELDGSEEPNTRIGNGNGNIMGDSGGPAFDSLGNVFFTSCRGDHAGSVMFVNNNDIGNSIPGTRSNPVMLFQNAGLGVGPAGLYSVHTLAVGGDQLVAGDFGRALFWNGLSAFSNGKPADGYLTNISSEGCPSSFTTIDAYLNDYYAMSANNIHLWVSSLNINLVGGKQPCIACFTLPLKSGDSPIYRLIGPINALGGGSVTPYGNWGIKVNSDSTEILLTQKDSNRAMRIRNPLTNPLVDCIFGQRDITSIQPNRGGVAAANTLAAPGGVGTDSYGNVFISDSSLETSGNKRLMVYLKTTVPSGNSSIILGPDADVIYPNVASWQPDFAPSNGKMNLPYNRYGPAPISGGYMGAFPGIYNNPLVSSSVPDAFIADFYSEAVASVFDINGNLYIADNRNRIMIYSNPMG